MKRLMALLVAGAMTTNPAISFADQVFTDDVIIQQSACVGQDCVNGENFGFDTLRLKENNLRFHIDDTSNSSSFPNNDWRLIFNDSTDGGGSYFAVEDATAGRQVFRVEATAPANALYVDSGGDVGIGTSVPVVEVHAVDGNTPAMRLDQDGSSGFTPQVWDVAGNETNFFVRDVTNGSALPFKIKPGAANNALVMAADGNLGLGTQTPGLDVHMLNSDTPAVRLEQTGADAQVWDIGANEANFFVRDTTDANKLPLRIRPGTPTNTLLLAADDAGRVGMGTDSPDSQLHVYGVGGTTSAKIQEDSTTVASRTVLTVANNGAVRLLLSEASTNNDWYQTANTSNEFTIANNPGGTTQFTIASNGDVTALGVFNSLSDVNAKKAIDPVDGSEVLERLDQMPVSEWSYKTNPSSVRHVGPMAQDFHAAFGLGDDNRRVAATDMAGVALAGVKQLNQEIKKRDEALRWKDEELRSLAARLSQLEMLVGRLQAGAEE